jgi:hypothetical protein
MDVAKVDRDVVYVASVSAECCKPLFKMFHLCFRRMFASVLIWMLHMFHICCKSIFQMFQSYITAGVFMLQVISVYLKVAYIAMAIHVCCKCMFQIF